jgi:hypothetical protein
LIVQGPLGIRVTRGATSWPRPRLENAELSTANPPTLERLRAWLQVPIVVRHRPDWVFLKLHCHSMDPRDTDSLIGEAMTSFLRTLHEYASSARMTLHFLTAREMTNVLLAVCDGREGAPGDYRDYKLRLIHPHALS